MKTFPVLQLSVSLVFLATSIHVSGQVTPHPGLTTSPDYGKLPLSFEPNRGQATPYAQFLAHGQGYTLLLRQDEALLELRSREESAGKKQAVLNSIPQSNISLVHIRLVGANPLASAQAEEQQTATSNYFLGNNPTKWRTGIPNYSRIRVRSVYEGIDLVYYGNQRELEHDFIVSAHANPARIALAFDNSTRPSLDPVTGDLVLSGFGNNQADLRLMKPRAYQESHGKRGTIPSSYKLLPNGEVGFTVGSYNHALPLIIDPVLVYSTYLGGSGSTYTGDHGNGIAVDSAGNAYVTGITTSADFPVTTGAFQTQTKAPSGTSTVFVSKLNPTGTALIYSTYLGGSGGDAGYGIALDSNNNAYITGATYSADFPVTCGALQVTDPSTTSGASTGFVTKLSASGSALLYSTYLGGSGNHASPPSGDASQAIVVNANGNAYITGYTYSSDFPTTTGAFQADFKGNASNSNAFVAELNPEATALVYSTYLGGSGVTSGVSGVSLSSAVLPGDYGNAIALDGAGDAFVAGGTWSADFPVTSGAFQTTLQGPSNAFITELNPAGSKQIYSTYLGGSGQKLFIPTIPQDIVSGDAATAVAVDSNGFVYVAGNTTSSNFPVTAGVLEGADDFDGANGTGFVAKFKQDGSALVFSTYLQGAGTVVSSLAADTAGNSYVAGSVPAASAGMTAGFQTTPDALPNPSSAGSSAFLVKINSTATAFNYATLLGGSSNDGANALALDTAGNVYLTGSADSANFPVTAGAFQTSNLAASKQSPSDNAFISKLALAAETNTTTYPTLPTNVPSTLDVVSSQIDEFCFIYDQFTLTVNLALSGAASWPPPTGTISLLVYGSFLSTYPVPAASRSGPVSFAVGGDIDYTGTSGPSEVGWTVSYSGDSVYAPSSGSGSNSLAGCPGGGGPYSVSGPASTASSSVLHLQLQPRNNGVPATRPISNSERSAQAGLNLLGPKFQLPAASPSSAKSISNAATSDAVPACIAQTALTVTLQPASRVYGAANPTFTYTVTGLLNGDTVTVTPSTTATVSSAPGPYPITATVTGTNLASYTLTVNNGTLTVTKAPASVSGPASQPVMLAGDQAATIAVTVAGANTGQGIAIPSGSLAYALIDSSGKTAASGTVGLTVGSSSSTASVPIPATLTPGSYTLNVTYGGDANYAAATAPIAIAIAIGKITPSLTWPPPAGITYGSNLSAILNPSAKNGSAAIPGAFSYTATPAGGTAAAVTATTILGAGSYSLTALFTPTDTATYTTASVNISLMVAKATPSLTLASSANPAAVSNAVTFTATASSPAGTPTGSINFNDGTTLLGAVNLASGAAAYTTTVLPSGNHSITAAYSGDSNFTAVTTSALDEAIDDFSLNISSSGGSTVTVKPGNTATYQLTFAPMNGSTFPAPINLAVSGLPTGAKATITPSTIPSNSGTTTVTLAVSVPSQTAMQHSHEPFPRTPFSIALGLIVLPFVGRFRRRFRGRGASLGLLLFFLMGATLFTALPGCGGHSGSTPTPKTYKLTITGTSGSLSRSTTVTLIVE